MDETATPLDVRSIRFEAALRTVDERAIVRLPDDASAKLRSRGQVAVNGVVNGRAFETVLEPDGMRGHWLKVDDRMRRILAIGDDDIVSVELEPTKIWPEPEVPGDLRAALDNAPDLADVWGGITPMARWEWVRWVNATKNPETRGRRVEVSVSKLRSGKRRPCCFDLTSCTDPELSKNGKLLDTV